MNICFDFGLNVWRILTTLKNSPSPLHHIAWSLARPGNNSRRAVAAECAVQLLQYALCSGRSQHCALLFRMLKHQSLRIQSPLSVHIIISTNNLHIFRSQKRLAFEWCLIYVDQLKIYLKNKNAGRCGLLLPVGDFQPSKN